MSFTSFLFTGNLISGTHCSRIFSDCDKKPCRLQSPNFPGIYPRNLTCYYAVRQVRHFDNLLIQKKNWHKIRRRRKKIKIISFFCSMKFLQANMQWLLSNKLKEIYYGLKLKGIIIKIKIKWVSTCRSLWRGMNVIRCRWIEWQNDKKMKCFLWWNFFISPKDYITIFDGYTTRDPVILKFCGGGGYGLPAAISSGPELLIEFVTSPYGTLKPSPVRSSTLFGFQLEVRRT